MKAVRSAELHIYQGSSADGDLCHTARRGKADGLYFNEKRGAGGVRKGKRLTVDDGGAKTNRIPSREEGHWRTPGVSWSLIAGGLLVRLPQPAGRSNEFRSYFTLTKWHQDVLETPEHSHWPRMNGSASSTPGKS